MKKKFVSTTVGIILAATGSLVAEESIKTVDTTCSMEEAKVASIEEEIKLDRVDDGFLKYRSLTTKEKGDLKACEIAKEIPDGKLEFASNEYNVEITGIEKMEGGITVFARAFTNNGEQIGFGPDGSVDIERFRIFNPPVLVDDPNGDIIREWDEKNIVTGVDTHKVRILREDPLEAIKQTLSHTIAIKTEKYIGSKIEGGKVGNTTSTFYPDPNVETTSVDGLIYNYKNNAQGGWAAAQGDTSASGGAANDSTVSTGGNYGTSVGSIAGNGNDREIVRAFFLFDTSSLADGDTITSATMSTYVTGKNTTFAGTTDNDGNDYLTILQSNPASNIALASADWDMAGDAIDNPTKGSSDIDITSISTSAYTDWALNATGLTWVSKTGITKLAMREGHDQEDDNITSSLSECTINFYYADQTGTSNDPKLVVESDAGAVTTLPGEDIWY